MRAKRIDKRNIRRAPAARDDDSSNTRHIVARIECPPCPVEEHLYPCAEIHRVDDGHSNVAEMSIDIARRNIEAPAQRQRKVGEVSTDSDALVKCLECSSGRSRLKVIELDVLMHKIASRLHASPAWSDIAEPIPSGLAQLVSLAISAAHKIKETFVRQVCDRKLGSAKGRPCQSCRRPRSSHRP